MSRLEQLICYYLWSMGETCGEGRLGGVQVSSRARRDFLRTWQVAERDNLYRESTDTRWGILINQVQIKVLKIKVLKIKFSNFIAPVPGALTLS